MHARISHHGRLGKVHDHEPPGRRVCALAVVSAAVLLQAGLVHIAWAAPVPETGDGVPPLPIPTYEEIGLAPFSIPTGPAPIGNDTVPPDSGSGGGGGTAGGESGDGSDSISMVSLTSQSWGAAASQYAQSLGVNPVVVAATCQIEANGCQTNPSSGSATITGTFQMRDDTYTAAMNSALARNPDLVSNIVPGLAGKLDPATQSVAAAEYLRQGAVSLQGNQVSNPTVLDVRGYYNFGPGNAADIARAESTDLISAHISGLTAAQFKANGIDPAATTVGQWRAGVVNKIGASAANAHVLLGSS